MRRRRGGECRREVEGELATKFENLTSPDFRAEPLIGSTEFPRNTEWKGRKRRHGSEEKTREGREAENNVPKGPSLLRNHIFLGKGQEMRREKSERGGECAVVMSTT